MSLVYGSTCGVFCACGLFCGAFCAFQTHTSVLCRHRLGSDCHYVDACGASCAYFYSCALYGDDDGHPLRFYHLQLDLNELGFGFRAECPFSCFLFNLFI